MDPNGEHAHTPEWMRLCDAQGTCLHVKNGFNSSASSHLHRSSTALLALGLEG